MTTQTTQTNPISKLVQVLETSETELDENNIKTRVTIGIKENGDKVKITETIKVTTYTRKIPRAVLERRNMPKFGACAGKPPGIEPGVTSYGEEIFIIPTFGNRKTHAPEPVPTASGPKIPAIACGKCGEDHFTSRCTSNAASVYSSTVSTGKYVPPIHRAGYKPATEEPEPDAGSGGGGNKYVPPSRRGGGGARGNEPPSVRISNLSDDITKEDLLDLLEPFGPVGRVAIPNDRRTGLPRGFAFVNFHSTDDGQRCVDELNGYGYNHLILRVEWAKPRVREIT